MQQLGELRLDSRKHDHDGKIELIINKGNSSFPHRKTPHVWINIHYVVEGTGYYVSGNELTPVSRGQFLMTPHAATHGFRQSVHDREPSLLVYTCQFHADLLHNWKRCFTKHTPIHTMLYGADEAAGVLNFKDARQQLLPIMSSMHNEFQKKNTGYVLMLTSMLVQLLVCLQRSDTPDLSAAPVTDPMAHEIAEYIERHYQETLTVQQIADHFYISASHFQRMFKRFQGVTFKQYLQSLRIHKCCELLQSSHYSVQQIANDIGYQDMKFFHALFRKKTGVTPQQYRHRFRSCPEPR